MYDSDGAQGIGYAGTFSRRYLRPLVTMIEALAELLIGEDPTPVEVLWRRLQKDVAQISLQGVGQVATAALDIALWDLKGKHSGQPVFRLLGGARERVPAYASTYFVGVSTTEDCVKVAGELAAQGFRAMKLSPAHDPDPHVEARRIGAIHEAVAPKAALILDCFQAWTPAHALRVGRLLESCNLLWIEDPVPALDLRGCAAVARGLDTPIAIGEWFYALDSFQAIVSAGAADILMIDLQRVGGFTGWQRIAAFAEAQQLPVVSHLMTEINLHAMAATPGGYLLEYSPWSFPLFTNPPALDRDGQVPLGDRPGLGLELNDAALQRFSLA
jgi:L-alanine-DL-glutamate epimerase-like enolase superfamily enzyme